MLLPSDDVMLRNKELLFSVTAKDCRFDYYRGSGKGGQKRNKTSNAVRCVHIKSNATGQAEDTRSQTTNKRLAFRRMVQTPKFQHWLKIETARQSGKLAEINESVDRELRQNVRVEARENGQWIEIL